MLITICDICGNERNGPYKPFPAIDEETRLRNDILDIFPSYDVCIVCMTKINNFVKSLIDEVKDESK